MPTEKDKKISGALEPAKIHKLEELVDYADGSVVSRTIAKTKTATVTLFSFDKGQALSEHSAPFDAIVQILDGEAELVIGGESIITRAGETVVMPADIPHAVNAVKKFKMLLTMLRE
ncbi:MAG: cupin domain-containing protein [Candidatus Zixiibacteriota bacterium]|nr:MAG: cupin domain-containing protein [candidate division Zixibacteria bacterium]HHI02213.1 cupin domain-containing protein [candidate division Zixibacteria bacterium]